MELYTWKISLPILFVLFLLHLNWIRKTQWNLLRKQYPAEKYQFDNVRLKYGNANIGGMYKWNSVFSAIEGNGILLRKPYPFSLLMPAIFIPWDAVAFISIVDGIEHRKKAKSKIIQKLNPFKYADIHLDKIEMIPVVVIWKEAYRVNVPPEKLK